MPNRVFAMYCAAHLGFVMTQKELLYPIAMTFIPGIGDRIAREIIGAFGSPEELFRQSPESLRKLPRIGERLADHVQGNQALEKAEQELQCMAEAGITGSYLEDSGYPAPLRECEDAPLVLYRRGSLDLSKGKWISVVGTRNATRYGLELCDRIIEGLGAQFPDLVVVSGLAYGIDIAAHRAALKAGVDTCAVLAHGLKTVYPPDHREMATQIAERGALLSDFHSAVRPERFQFVRRNRIIAGLSEATLVVESGARGGALITAELAASYHREVMAVPGRAVDPWSAGCNRLIRSNLAALVEHPGDVADILKWSSEPSGSSDALSGGAHSAYKKSDVQLTPMEKAVVKVLEETPELHWELLGKQSQIEISKLMGVLLQMELKGYVVQLPGNRYRLC